MAASMVDVSEQSAIVMASGNSHEQSRSAGLSDSQWTPPQTPLSSSYLEAEDDMEQEAGGFHNYLRAFYPYHPASTISSSEGDESSVTVPINQGDVILVHSVQPNGWADGTLLASGARGWLPTNYCEPFDPDLMRNLLDALTYTWEFVRGHEEDDPQVFRGQDYVRGVIAGVRLLLQQTNCLSREEPLIKNVHSLRRARRYMLSDLSAFSKATSSLQDVCQSGLSRDIFYDMLDDIVIRAFRVTTRAVKFLDSWTHHNGERMQEHTPPLTPPFIVSEDENGENSEQYTCQRRSAAFRLSGISQACTPMSPMFSAGLSAGVLDPPVSDSLSIPLSSAARSTRPTSFLQKRASASHRLSYSYSARGTLADDRKFASESLTAAHDAFLSSLGVFTGLHLQSRASMELLSETKQAVVACSALLDIIEEIMLRDHRHFHALEAAKEQLKASVASLIQTIGAQSSDDEDFVVRQAQNPPIQAATSCVRSASACVAEASAVIERIGDFELASDRGARALEITHAIESTSPGQKERPTPLIIEEEGYDIVEKPLPDSPPPPTPPSQSDKTHEPATFPNASRSSSRLEAPHTSADAMASRVSCDTVVRPGSSLDAVPTSDRKKIPSLELDIPQTSPLLFPELSTSLEQSPDSVNDSRGVSFTGTNSTDLSSIRWSKTSVHSQASTVATTPDQSPVKDRAKLDLNSSFSSLSESQSTIADDSSDDGTEVFTTHFAHELLLSKDGQILGGTLPALVERLTIHDVTPDAMFVNTFYLTFRQFCTPVEFAQALSDRFDYIGSSPLISGCVRLRIVNVIKGWLDLHWRCDTDNEALPVLLALAHGTLTAALPTASSKLLQLLERASFTTQSGRVHRVVSLQGKANTVIGSTDDLNSPEPSSAISKSQWSLLKKFELQTATPSILDFEPLELARQFTLIESKIFCQIRPEELLDCEFNKCASSSKAVNVKAMSKLSTDLANLVADTILQHSEPKKRAAVIKQWVKIAKKCRELNNYDSLVAILCSLNSSMIARLKKTWDIVPAKTVARLEELRPIGEGRMTVLRKLLENHGAPCIPFVGLTLTDLTMNHEANAKTRKLGRAAGSACTSGAGAEKNIINFDRYFRTARSIGDLQRFQVEYNLKAVPAMQAWMRSQIERVHVDKDASAAAYYRRSVMLEPRDMPQQQASLPGSANTSFSSVSSVGDRPALSSKQSFWTSLGLREGMHSKEKVLA